MAELRHDDVLNFLGLEKTKKDMIVLGAILKAQTEPSEFIDFETLREQLAKDEGKRKGKDSLVYRSLSWLEKEGFVTVDRSSHKHGYNAKISNMQEALSTLIAGKTKSLEKEIRQLDSKIANLTQMEEQIDFIAGGIIKITGGKTKIERPVFAQGWDNILRLLDDKLYTGLKKGDILRFTLDWLAQNDYANPKRLKQFSILLDKGIETRALDHNRSERGLRGVFRKMLRKLQKEGYLVGYRIHPRKDATYQFVARNTEGIVLVVSESPLSATWLSRDVNPELVDSAIATFDKDYNAGTDLAEYGE